MKYVAVIRESMTYTWVTQEFDSLENVIEWLCEAIIAIGPRPAMRGAR